MPTQDQSTLLMEEIYTMKKIKSLLTYFILFLKVIQLDYLKLHFCVFVVLSFLFSVHVFFFECLLLSARNVVIKLRIFFDEWL